MGTFFYVLRQCEFYLKTEQNTANSLLMLHSERGLVWHFQTLSLITSSSRNPGKPINQLEKYWAQVFLHFFISFILCFWAFAIHVCKPMTCSALRVQKRVTDPWNWSYWWLLAQTSVLQTNMCPLKAHQVLLGTEPYPQAH